MGLFTAGAKMHSMTNKSKGHEYQYFVCSEKRGFPSVRMAEVDRAVIEYLHDLLSTENQDKIAAALRQYQAGEGSRMEEFKEALQQRIEGK